MNKRPLHNTIRPWIITLVCAILVLIFIGSISYVSEEVGQVKKELGLQQTSTMAILWLNIISVVYSSLIGGVIGALIYGLWNMKKWGLYMFYTIEALNIVSVLAAFSFTALFINTILIFLVWRHRGKFS